MAVRGSDRGGQRAAQMYRLIVTSKMNNVDPQAWLADVLARIAEHPAQKLDELLPWNWRPGYTVKTRRPDHGCDHACLHDRLRRQDAERGRGLARASIDMDPEDGRMWVYGVGEDGVPAFTKDGIENLRQIIADERSARRAPPQVKSAK